MYVYMCIYIYMCACSPPQNQPKQHVHRYLQGKKQVFFQLSTPCFTFSNTRTEHIYIYTYIYLFIDRSTYLSIYLKIDKFNMCIIIYIYTYVCSPPRIHQNSIFTCICEEKSVLPTIYSTTTVSTGIFILYMRKMLLQWPSQFFQSKQTPAACSSRQQTQANWDQQLLS